MYYWIYIYIHIHISNNTHIYIYTKIYIYPIIHIYIHTHTWIEQFSINRAILANIYSHSSLILAKPHWHSNLKTLKNKNEYEFKKIPGQSMEQFWPRNPMRHSHWQFSLQCPCQKKKNCFFKKKTHATLRLAFLVQCPCFHNFFGFYFLALHLFLFLYFCCDGAAY